MSDGGASIGEVDTVLLAVTGGFAASLSLRTGFSVDVIKDRGTLARVVEDGVVENMYRLQIANGTEQTRRYRVSVDGLPGLHIVSPAEVTIEGTGLLARALQHEMDHLDGMLFVDRLRGISRTMILRKVKKLERDGKW